MSKSTYNSGEKHYAWKGDNIGYHALHKWLRKNMPKPEECQGCNKKESLELANITGIYTRDFINYKYLCHKCHHILDGRDSNLIQYFGTPEQRSNATHKAWKTRKIEKK